MEEKKSSNGIMNKSNIDSITTVSGVMPTLYLPCKEGLASQPTIKYH